MPFILASRPTSTPILQVQLRSSVQPGRSLPPVYAPHTPLFQTTAAGHAEDHITSLTKAESSKHPVPCHQLGASSLFEVSAFLLPSDTARDIHGPREGATQSTDIKCGQSEVYRPKDLGNISYEHNQIRC